MGKIIAVDFDGTIDDYTGWKGEQSFNRPVPLARQGLKRLQDMGFTIVVNTCRTDVNAIAEYMQRHKLPHHYINFSPRNVHLGLSSTKLAADVYVDDKAVCFTGVWDHHLINNIIMFQEHWR